MATWSTDSADFIQKLNDEEYKRQKAAEQLMYDRQRQAIKDQQAKQMFDLNYATAKRTDDLAKAQHDYNIKNLDCQ